LRSEISTMEGSENLRDTCKEEWAKLKTLQTHLESREPITIDERNPQVQILQEQEKRYTAEIETISTTGVIPLPENPDILRHVLKQEQETKIDQLNETLLFLRAQRGETQSNIEAEDKTHKLLLSLNSALKEKMKAKEDISSQEKSSAIDAAISSARVDLDHVNKMNTFFKKELRTLLENHFSLDEAEKAKNLDDTRDFDKANALPMVEIVRLFIEQTLNFPARPYIDIDERFSPRHIEFLLRCQIVMKDPIRETRMKLVPFHM